MDGSGFRRDACRAMCARRLRVSAEDMAIAALVMMPFTLRRSCCW